MTRILIVGAGVTGHRAAVETRKLAPSAEITLLGSEQALPYDRPPLSKDVLLGNIDASQIIFPEAHRYNELAIDYRGGVVASSIDRAARNVLTANGSTFGYDKLLLATGSRVKSLPPALDMPRVRYLRTLSDATTLRAELSPGVRVVIIGGGFIGLEVAAAARKLGCRVSVVEMQDRILSRGLPRMVSGAVCAMHEANGVDILTGRKLLALRETAAGPIEVETTAETLTADVVVAGIGIAPNVEIAANAGLKVADGIVVDRSCRTSDASIYAAGEVTAHPGADGELRRLEAWKVSSEQALVAVRGMLNMEASYDTPPWFWSDQYEHNLQVVGTVTNVHSYRLKGDLASSQWTLVGTNEDQIPVGAVAMNGGRDISMLRRAISKQSAIPSPLATALVELRPMEDASRSIMQDHARSM